MTLIRSGRRHKLRLRHLSISLLTSSTSQTTIRRQVIKAVGLVAISTKMILETRKCGLQTKFITMEPKINQDKGHIKSHYHQTHIVKVAQVLLHHRSATAPTDTTQGSTVARTGHKISIIAVLKITQEAILTTEGDQWRMKKKMILRSRQMRPNHLLLSKSLVVRSEVTPLQIRTTHPLGQEILSRITITIRRKRMSVATRVEGLLIIHRIGRRTPQVDRDKLEANIVAITEIAIVKAVAVLMAAVQVATIGRQIQSSLPKSRVKHLSVRITPLRIR